MSLPTYGITAGGLPQWSPAPADGTRSAAFATAYQPSATQRADVRADATILLATSGAAKIELLSDAANPPTTVIATASAANASLVSTVTVPCHLSGIVQAGHYYLLKKTDTAGTNTFAIIGNVQEHLL